MIQTSQSNFTNFESNLIKLVNRKRKFKQQTWDGFQESIMNFLASIGWNLEWQGSSGLVWLFYQWIQLVCCWMAPMEMENRGCWRQQLAGWNRSWIKRTEISGRGVGLAGGTVYWLGSHSNVGSSVSCWCISIVISCISLA